MADDVPAEKPPEEKPLVEFDFGNGNHAQRLFTMGQIKEWWQQEVATWADLTDATRSWNTHGLPALSSTWRETRTVVDQAIEFYDKDNSKLADLESAFTRYGVRKLYATSTMAGSAALLLYLYKKPSEKLKERFAEATRHRPEAIDLELLFGLTQVEFRENKLAEDELRHEQLDRLAGDFNELLNKLRDHEKHAHATIEQRNKTADGSLEQQHQQYTQAFQTWSSDLESLKKTFLEFMTLEAPVDYWQKKADEHKKGRVAWGYRSLLVGVLAVLVFLLAIPQIFPFGQQANVPNHVLLKSVVLSITLVAMLLWPTRVCVRMFLSHAHLETDAAEREIIARTYFAMVHEEKLKVEPTDRALLLRAMFRHAATGIVKDDSSPAMTTEVLGKVLNR